MGRRTHVVVRLRPGDGDQTCVNIGRNSSKEVVVADVPGAFACSVPHSFYVDRVVDERYTNEELFNNFVYDRIRSSADQPDTSCFLAYGHTNSGKTHTIAGGRGETGLLSLAAKSVLKMYGYLEVAMIEVYGENVHDLLARGKRRLVRRRSGPDGVAIIVEDLTTCSLSTIEEWEAVSAFGMGTRRTAPTERNPRSSRSHALFTIKSRGLRLCMVDLAGSERQTTYSPQLNSESIAINKSLSRLSTVLEALSTMRRKPDGTSSYVNFRDTTLTVLLQRYLCGASMTVFVACIHPDVQFVQETMSTLRYTQRLKRIKTKSAPQKPSDDSSLFHPKEHQDLLEELALLRKIVNQSSCGEFSPQNDEALAASVCRRHFDPSTPQRETGPETENNDQCNSSGLRHKQRLIRSKDIRRVAGWLVSRTLGMLPHLSVRFDDYFDDFLPCEVQVVGYVSLMACLPPCDKAEASHSLAFLDVGDPALGLSMLDAGIPACVGLHRLDCKGIRYWEVHEYDETNSVFLLAFFRVGEGLVEPMDVSGNPFECCGGVLTLEPLVPLALVFGTSRDTCEHVKENVLQHLITLQTEQGHVTEGNAATQTSRSLYEQGSASCENSVRCGCRALVDTSETTYSSGVDEETEFESIVTIHGTEPPSVLKEGSPQSSTHTPGRSPHSREQSDEVHNPRRAQFFGGKRSDASDVLSSLSVSSSNEEGQRDLDVSPGLTEERVACTTSGSTQDQSPQSTGEQIITDRTDMCDGNTSGDPAFRARWLDGNTTLSDEIEQAASNVLPDPVPPPSPQHTASRFTVLHDRECTDRTQEGAASDAGAPSGKPSGGKGKNGGDDGVDSHRKREPVSEGCHLCVML